MEINTFRCTTECGEQSHLFGQNGQLNAMLLLCYDIIKPIENIYENYYLKFFEEKIKHLGTFVFNIYNMRF